MHRCRPTTRALALAALALPYAAHAQLSLSTSSDRWVFGGGVGASFGNVTFVQVSPYVGCRVTDAFTAGVGLQYRYRNDDRFEKDLTTQDVGTSVFGRYALPGPFFVHGEYEYLSYQFYREDGSKTRTGVSSVLGGGGISQPLGANASAFALLLYNFSYDRGARVSPYSSPWVLRVGVGVRF